MVGDLMDDMAMDVVGGKSYVKRRSNNSYLLLTKLSEVKKLAQVE